MEPMPATIAKGIVDAQKIIKTVEKASTNQYHHYKYASGEDVLIAGRGALNTAGLALLTEGWAIRHGDENIPDAVDVSYLLCHTDGSQWRPHSVETPIIPDKGRPPDKALAAALTYNLAYYLRGLLLIPRAETEAEVDKRNDSAYTPPPRAASNGTTRLNPAITFRDFVAETIRTEGGLWGASPEQAKKEIVEHAADAVKMTPDALRNCRDEAIFFAATEAVKLATKQRAESVKQPA